MPIAADVVRRHGADAADVVTTEAPLPGDKVAADSQVVLLPVPAAGERDAEGRTRGAPVIKCLRRTDHGGGRQG